MDWRKDNRQLIVLVWKLTYTCDYGHIGKSHGNKYSSYRAKVLTNKMTAF